MNANQISRFFNRTSTRTASVLAVSALAFGLSSLTPASADDDSGRRGGAECSHQAKGKGHGERMGKGHQMGREGNAMGGMMRGLNLTDEQRDQMFALRHAAAPKHRELRQQIGAKRQAMSELTKGQAYEADKVRTLADEMGRLTAEAEVMRAQMKQSMMAILTDEQRSQIQERMNDRQQRGGKGGQHRGPGRGSDERGPRHG